MNTRYFPIAAFGLLMLLCAPVHAYRFEGTESQITTNPENQFDPSISGPITVFTDTRNEDMDIYYYDIEQGQEQRVTFGGGDQLLNDVSGDIIVYTDYSDGDANIYIYDITTNQSQAITDNPAQQRRPNIDGNRIVYEDNRNGNYDIYMYDLSTNTETQLTSDPADQIKPVVSGDVVVWEDRRSGDPDIYMLDLSTWTMTPVADGPALQTEPSVDGDIVAWTSDENSPADIFYYRISTGETVEVSNDGDIERKPKISGDYIAYEKGSISGGDLDIWLYSISLAVEQQATIDPADQYLHDISGNRIVYTDNRNDNLDIYMFEFIFDEPPIGGEGCDDPDAVVLFGPRVYTRGHGHPTYIIDGFAGRDIAGDAFVCISNGDQDGENMVTSAHVALNDEIIASPDDFNPGVDSLEIPVQLQDINAIAVRLTGKPGSQFTMRVVSAPVQDDPVIITCDSADPSAGSWNTALVFFALLFIPLAFMKILRSVPARGSSSGTRK